MAWSRWPRTGCGAPVVQAKLARALSAFLASAPRREPRQRHRPSIALFVAQPTDELASVRVLHGHRVGQGAKLFGVDPFARSYRRRKATSLPRRVIVTVSPASTRSIKALKWA